MRAAQCALENCSLFRPPGIRRFAEVVLLTADGVGTNEIMRRAAKSKTCVWRWQARFTRGSMDCSATRRFPSASSRSASETAERVAALTLGELQPSMSCLTGYLLLNPTFPQFGLHGLGKV